MQKIKITSTTRIHKPKALEHIDVSYGLSFVIPEDFSIITIDENNSYFMKLCANLDKLGYVFMNKEKKNENKLIIKQILEDTSFIEKYHRETVDNLQLQINDDNYITKKLKKYSYKENNNIIEYLDENISLLASNENQKTIFLGLNCFKPGDTLYDELSPFLTREEIISFVLFHEQSHSAEFINNMNYNRQNINNHFDRLYDNLLYINNDEVHNVVKELIQDDNNFELPSIRLINTLTLLHQEMYADVRAILVQRNKSIINQEFNPDKTKHYIKVVSSLRKNEKNVVRESGLNKNIISHHHFTSPSIESLERHLNDFLKNHNKDKILNEEEMHLLTVKCVQEGIARTLLAIEKSDKQLEKQINTLFSIAINDYTLNLNKDNYMYARHEINDIVAPEFKENFSKNLAKVKNVSESIVFDAVLDNDTFEKRLLQQSETNNKNNITVDMLQKSFDSIFQAMDKDNSNIDISLKDNKMVEARIGELRDKTNKPDNIPKIK